MSGVTLVGLARKLLRGHRPILIDFPPHPRPRWSRQGPGHPAIAEILGRERAAYADRLAGIVACRERLARIPLRGSPETGEPYWVNGFLPGFDAAAIYAFVASRAPRRYVEIGSGHSTRFAARAIRDHGLATTITSIDPSPRASVERLATRVLRQPLEEVDPAEVAALVSAGDVLFYDGSHRVFENSDVTVFFLDVLPRLVPGVLVHVHDICLPHDYPDGWEDRWYSEQYLLAAWLLGGGAGMRLVLPNAFVSTDAELRAMLEPLWAAPELAGVERHGSSFWFETTPR